MRPPHSAAPFELLGPFESLISAPSILVAPKRASEERHTHPVTKAAAHGRFTCSGRRTSRTALRETEGPTRQKDCTKRLKEQGYLLALLRIPLNLLCLGVLHGCFHLLPGRGRRSTVHNGEVNCEVLACPSSAGECQRVSLCLEQGLIDGTVCPQPWRCGRVYFLGNCGGTIIRCVYT